MTISIVTPVYNGLPQIRRTLDSLARQSVPFEHLVMDACSPDGTGAVVKEYANSYDVTLSSERDEGVYDAVAKGFARTRGDILAWLNAGDVYMPFTLALVQWIFETYPDVDWITGIPGNYYEERDAICLDPFTPVYSQTAVRRGWHNGYWLSPLQQESSFWRRSLWDKAGGREVLLGKGRGKGYASDFQLWRRFAQHSRPRTVCSLLAAFAITKGQISETFRQQYYQECGVSSPPAHPVRLLHFLWAIYSFLNARDTIKGHHLKARTAPRLP
ncbi:MAG TPA: glycosyltransferase [Candidatus Limnocylindria bacterium]|jgi:glycosyltransferase involved in cell wall biosynthesis|nr:glycosyltransferase [Candidatus Limnocylindria bacterium]